MNTCSSVALSPDHAENSAPSCRGDTREDSGSKKRCTSGGFVSITEPRIFSNFFLFCDEKFLGKLRSIANGKSRIDEEPMYTALNVRSVPVFLLLPTR